VDLPGGVPISRRSGAVVQTVGPGALNAKAKNAATDKMSPCPLENPAP
jgi:hypothetical protein